MKSSAIYLNWVIPFLLSIFICVSCQKDEENAEDISPTDPRDIITGAWLCDETEVGNPDVTTFTVTVSKLDGTDDGLELYNLGLTSGNVIGYLDSLEVDIPKQSVNLINIEGKGYIISDNKSNWTYRIIMQGDTIDCYAGFRPF